MTRAQAELDHRRLVALTLAIASAGGSVPYGISSSLASDAMKPLEWALSGVAFVAFVGLVWDLVDRTPSPHAWPFLIAGFVWTTITVYVILVGNATFLWHLGNGLIDGSIAVLALTSWRLAVVQGRRGRQP